jgi:hypothetical protein
MVVLQVGGTGQGGKLFKHAQPWYAHCLGINVPIRYDYVKSYFKSMN